MRRIVDVSQIIEPNPPVDMPLPPDIRPPHSEPYGANRSREEIMFQLYIENAHFGEPQMLDAFQYLTTTVDPAGTHVETYFPAKWFYDGVGAHTARDVAHIPTRTLVNEASVVQVNDLERPMGPGDLAKAGRHIQEGDGVIFKSNINQRWEDPGYRGGIPTDAYDQRTGLTAEGARWLTDRSVRLAAVDFRTPEDPSFKWELPSHRQLHVNDVLIVEDIAHVRDIESERLLLMVGAPIKGRYLTGGPARIVGLEGWGTASPRVVDLTHVMGASRKTAQSSSRAEDPQREQDTLGRAEFSFFDVSQTGLSDLVGPQYMRLSSRVGTHIVNPSGPRAQMPPARYGDITEIPIDRLVRSGCLVDATSVGPNGIVRPQDIEAQLRAVRDGDWVVLRTGHSDWFRNNPEGAFNSSPSIAPETLAAVARSGASGILTDLSSPAELARRGELYSILDELDLLLVAGACKLWMVQKQRFLVAALPLRIVGMNASPVHAFIVEDWDDDSWL